mmetsp:Transcript_90718/g.194579  ORF Transcript_90718/g.194579 Transcript_90718/m.194579 type:complete len:582 (-) Transcript_90718:208-1953(-)
MVAYFAAACAVIAAVGVTAQATETHSTPTASQDQSGAAADYQKYISQYAGKYAGGAGGAANYEKYMSQKSQGGDYAQYMAMYAGDYTKTDTAGDYQKYMAEYSKGGDYQKYVAMQDKMKSTALAPMSPDQCKNETELRAWRSHQFEQIETFVPKSFQSQGRDAVEKQYQQRLLQLQGKNATMAQTQTQQLPQFLMSAAACKNTTELKAWYDHQIAVLKKNVPKEYQHFPLQAVEQQYKTQLAKLQAQNSNATNQEAQKPSIKMLVQQSGAEQQSGAKQESGAEQQQKPAVDYHKYMPKVAGDYMKFRPAMQRNGADDHSHDVDFQVCTKMKQHAKVGDTAIDVPMVLATAQMCQKEQELRTLRACQEAEVDRNVPVAYQRFAIKKIEDQFQERLAQLKSANSSAHTAQASSAEEVPVLLITAQKCESEGELRAWRLHQFKEIDRHVPDDYKGLAKHIVERTFRNQLSRLQEQAQKVAEVTGEAGGAGEQAKPKADLAAEAKADETTAEVGEKADKKVEAAPIALAASATQKASGAAPVHIGWALGFVLLGLMTPAFIAALGRRQHTSSSDVYLLAEDEEVV